MDADSTEETQEPTGSEQEPANVSSNSEQNESTDASLADRLANLETKFDEGFSWLRGQFSTTTNRQAAAEPDSTSETSEETNEPDETVELVTTDQKVNPRKGSRVQINLSSLFR